MIPSVPYQGRQSRISRAQAEWGNARLAAVQLCAVLLAASDSGGEYTSYVLRWVLSRFQEDHGVTFAHVVEGLEARWVQQDNLRTIRGVTEPVSCISPLDLKVFEQNLKVLGFQPHPRKLICAMVKAKQERLAAEAAGWLE